MRRLRLQRLPAELIRRQTRWPVRDGARAIVVCEEQLKRPPVFFPEGHFFNGRRAMVRKLLMAAAGLASIAVAGAMPVVPAEAQSTCLRNNRIFGWEAMDDHTLVLSDRQRNRYTVRLNGGCLGLRENLHNIAFRTSTSLGCLRPGDRVSFRTSSFGPETCFVQSVELMSVNPRYRTDRDYYNDFRYRPDRDYYNDFRWNRY